jgi:hypothetical protein
LTANAIAVLLRQYSTVFSRLRLPQQLCAMLRHFDRLSAPLCSAQVPLNLLRTVSLIAMTRLPLVCRCFFLSVVEAYGQPLYRFWLDFSGKWSIVESVMVLLVIFVVLFFEICLLCIGETCVVPQGALSLLAIMLPGRGRDYFSISAAKPYFPGK